MTIKPVNTASASVLFYRLVFYYGTPNTTSTQPNLTLPKSVLRENGFSHKGCGSLPYKLWIFHSKLKISNISVVIDPILTKL